MDVTVLVCTYNRAAFLGSTLESLACLECAGLRREVLIVDNNSTDETRTVVESRQRLFPTTLKYVFEGRQGKSLALNTGLQHAEGRIIAFTDDDVRVPTGWLEAAVRPLLTRADIEYTGGPVRPMWEKSPPHWLRPDGNLGGTIAVKDHGDQPFIFEDQRKTPLGVNMAVRRQLCERLGGFNADFGRRGELTPRPGAGGIFLQIAGAWHTQPVRAGNGPGALRASRTPDTSILPAMAGRPALHPSKPFHPWLRRPQVRGRGTAVRSRRTRNDVLVRRGLRERSIRVVAASARNSCSVVL